MPTIEQIVEQIRHAVYGKDVRENIALGIETCYDDSQNNVKTADVANDLTQTGAGKVLDARQGKVLNDKFANYVKTADVANDLTQTGAGKVLDARQGKVLNDKKANFINLGNNISGNSFDDFMIVSCDNYYTISENDKADNIIATWSGHDYYTGIMRRQNTIVYFIMFNQKDIIYGQYDSTNYKVQTFSLNLEKNKHESAMKKLNDSYSESIGHYDFPMEYLMNPSRYEIGSVDMQGQIYFNNDEHRITKINKIKFLAKTGTTYFHIVTYDKINKVCSSELLLTIENSSSENNVMKEIDVNITLAKNQYIGINGMMCFVNGTDDHDNTVYRLADGTVFENQGQLILYTTEYEGSEIDLFNYIYEINTKIFGGEDYINIEEATPYGTISSGNTVFVQDIKHPISRFNRIQFRAVTGTMNVYKIEFVKDNEVIKYSQIASYEIPESENGKIITKRLINTLKPGQYIGVSGDFAWKNYVPGCWEWQFNIGNEQIFGKQHQTPLVKVYMDLSMSEDYDSIININTNIRGGKDLIDIESFNDYGTANLTDIIVNNGTEYAIGNINCIQYRAVEGTCSFYKIEQINELGNQVLRKQLIGTYTNKASEQGLIKTIKVDIQLNKNQYIGMSGNIAFTNDANGYYTWVASINDGSIGDPTDNQLVLFKVFYEGSLLEKKEDKKFRKYGEITLYNERLTSTNEDLVGDVHDGAYGISVSSRIRLNKFYASADREVRYQCKFSNNCIAYFETISDIDYSVMSTIFIDVENKQFGILNNHNIKDCPILNSIHEFIVSIYLHYDSIMITVIDMNNGQSVSLQDYNSFVGGAGRGAVCLEINHALPSFTGYYAFEKYSGDSFFIRKMVVTCAKCDILICGDSITEAYPYWPLYMYPNHWTQRIIKRTDDRAMVCAKGGCNIIQLREWLGNELPKIKPKYCMITIGTNGSNTIERLTELIQFVKAQGSVPILNHIPCFDKNGIKDFTAINNDIDTVRASEEVNGADFDIATSIDRSGESVNTSTMWTDEYAANNVIYIHPNEYGSLLMFNQLLIDTPEIFE